MMIEGFDEIFNTVYIAKKLFDMRKYELVEKCFYDAVDFDVYYEDMCLLVEKLFASCASWYYERRNMEVHIVSDPVIEDFYVLSGEYGQRHKIPDENNPYIREARDQVSRHLGFSYCLDWKLMGHAKPKRPFQSRLAVFIYMDDWGVDMGCLAYGLIEIYEWFADACAGLRKLLHEKQTGGMHLLRKEEAAA